MSKVKIQGNASGTGVVTLTAPNTNTDRTITLPDAEGTLVANTATGVDVTGSVTCDGLEVVDGSPSITIKDSNNTKSQTGYVGVIISKDSADADTWAIGRRFGSTALRIENKENSSTIFETNSTERMRITADGRGLSQFTAKAWVNFNGTGTVAIRDSHNVSSITDSGTGNYTVNLSNALANSNGCSVASGARYSGGGDAHLSRASYVTGTTTILAKTANTVGNASDHVYIGIAVFGD